MTEEFEVGKIVEYLEKYKLHLPVLYKWNAKIERLVELETLTEKQVHEINTLSPYEKELQLKRIIGQKLNDTQKSNLDLFNKLCLWVVKDWGGITTAKDNATLEVINDFLNQDKPKFQRIASTSKVGAYMFPAKNIIYDSRVSFALNWIILSQDAGQRYFPVPEGRNSKMAAFDINVLIRLKNISVYHSTDITALDHRLFINNTDKSLFINKKEAYNKLNMLIKDVNEKLWEGDKHKQDNLYYTEMLLFSIADREVIRDLTTWYGNDY